MRLRAGRAGLTMWETVEVIPTAILGGFVLGAFIRWWAVPVVGLLWAIVILFIEPSGVLVGCVLGAINGAVGALPAVAIRHAILSPSK
jgi:hypothetical protein